VAAVESTTLLGGLAGLFLLPGVSEVWLAVLVAHAGGGFLFLAAHAVLGEIIKHEKALVLTSFAGGLALIGALVLMLRFL
jgi:zinc transporter ZupT